MSEPSVDPTSKPMDAPREAGAKALRRSWGEPAVRFWWLSSVAIALIGLWAAGVNFIEEYQDQRLIRQGVRVEAMLISADGKTYPGYVVPPGQQSVLEFSYSLPGKPDKYQQTGQLKAQTRPVVTGKTFSIFVDPTDPARWTDRQSVDWLRALFLPTLLVAAAIPLALVSLWMRRAVLRRWREGEAREAIVIETRQAASAPRSRIVRFTLADSRDARVYSVVVPTRDAVLKAGDSLWVITEPGKPENAVAAAAYA